MAAKASNFQKHKLIFPLKSLLSQQFLKRICFLLKRCIRSDLIFLKKSPKKAAWASIFFLKRKKNGQNH